MTRVHVCSHPGCPNLTPCVDHGRPANAPWSRDRDRAAHARFARAVIARDGACTQCGATEDLQAHHVRPGYELNAGRTLCGHCHASVDTHARARRSV